MFSVSANWNTGALAPPHGQLIGQPAGRFRIGSDNHHGRAELAPDRRYQVCGSRIRRNDRLSSRSQAKSFDELSELPVARQQGEKTAQCHSVARYGDSAYTVRNAETARSKHPGLVELFPFASRLAARADTRLRI